MSNRLPKTASNTLPDAIDRAGLGISPASVEDFRQLARKRLPRQFFDYIDGGSYQELTARENVEAYHRTSLRQRVLKDVSQIDTRCELLGESLALPLVLAPVGLAGCYARRGEVQAARAAQSAKVPFCLSTVSICSIDEVHQATQAAFWFQLYVIRDRAFCIELLNKARNAGVNTLVFTVDLPVVGDRLRDVRNGLNGNGGLRGGLKRAVDILRHPRWIMDVAIQGKPLMFGNLSNAVPDARSLTDFKAWVDAQFDPGMTWDNLGWIRENWDGQLIIKGIMDTEDAKHALHVGADGIVISNHGGRQLDGAPATLDVLPEIKATVKDQCAVLIDGGIRSGADILRALALGADACLIGRAWAFALAAQGQQGVESMLDMLTRELRVAMALTGCTRLADIDEHVLRRAV